MTGQWHEASVLCWARLGSLMLFYILASIICRFSKTSTALNDALAPEYATSERHSNENRKVR